MNFDVLLRKHLKHNHVPAEIVGLADLLKGLQGEFDARDGTLEDPVSPPTATTSGFWLITGSGYINLGKEVEAFEAGDILVYTESTETYSRIDSKNYDYLLEITSTFTSSYLSGKTTQKAVNDAIDVILANYISAKLISGYLGAFDAHTGTLETPLTAPTSTTSGFWIISAAGYISIGGVSTSFGVGDWLVIDCSGPSYSKIDIQNDDLSTLITSTFLSSTLSGKTTQKAINEALDTWINSHKTVDENLYSANVTLDNTAVRSLGSVKTLITAPAAGYIIDPISIIIVITQGATALDPGSQNLYIKVSNVFATLSNSCLKTAGTNPFNIGKTNSTGVALPPATALTTILSSGQNPNQDTTTTMRFIILYRLVNTN